MVATMITKTKDVLKNISSLEQKCASLAATMPHATANMLMCASY